MLLYTLFAVLIWAIINYIIISGKTPAGLLFVAAKIQEKNAGTRSTGPGLFSAVILNFNAFKAVLRPVYCLGYNKPLFDIKPLKRANKRTTAPYTTDKSNRAESKNHHPETVAGRFSQSGRKIKRSIFCHFISKLWPQKPLGCVSKIEFFKNPKILDRGGF